MPATKDDILSLLSDPALSQIDFRVGAIVVNSREFANLSEFFHDGAIAVVKGTDIGEAAYVRATHTLEVDPTAEPPLDSSDNALLLHECVHTLVRPPVARAAVR